MTISEEIDVNAKLTDADIAEFKKAESMPPVFDEDSPQYSYNQLAEMLARTREQNRTEVVSLRLKSRTLKRARQLGKGYTSVLSRVIEYALDNPEIIEKSLVHKA